MNVRLGQTVIIENTERGKDYRFKGLVTQIDPQDKCAWVRVSPRFQGWFPFDMLTVTESERRLKVVLELPCMVTMDVKVPDEGDDFEVTDVIDATCIPVSRHKVDSQIQNRRYNGLIWQALGMEPKSERDTE